MTVVLDASALLAYLQEEPSGEVVDGVLAEAVMASVNWAEVIQKEISAGVEVDGLLEDVQALGMRVEPFLPADGVIAGLSGSLFSCTQAYLELDTTGAHRSQLIRLYLHGVSETIQLFLVKSMLWVLLTSCSLSSYRFRLNL